MTLKCINKYISETALKWFVAGCASKWTTFFYCWQAVSWSQSAASVQNSLSLIFSFGYIFLCYLMTCWKRTQCVPLADLDLFNHWQSENIQSFGLLVFYTNATDDLLEHVSQLPQQCETGTRFESPYSLNLIAVEQLKPLIRAVECVLGGEYTGHKCLNPISQHWLLSCTLGRDREQS